MQRTPWGRSQAARQCFCDATQHTWPERSASSAHVIAVLALCCTWDLTGAPESHSRSCCDLCAAGVLREERIEVAGALGKAQVLNKDLNALEQELGAAHRAGTADAFCLYLYGLILTDRHGLPQQPVLTAACMAVVIA